MQLASAKFVRMPSLAAEALLRAVYRVRRQMPRSTMFYGHRLVDSWYQCLIDWGFLCFFPFYLVKSELVGVHIVVLNLNIWFAWSNKERDFKDTCVCHWYIYAAVSDIMELSSAGCLLNIVPSLCPLQIRVRSLRCAPIAIALQIQSTYSIGLFTESTCSWKRSV